MQTWLSLDEARSAHFRHPVATLGVFDGVHIGHRYVISECMRHAAERAGHSVVVTFAQHPRAIIAGKAPKLITSIEHRLRLFESLGVDHSIVLTFDNELREMSPHRFAHLVFEDVIGAELVVLGHNCRFGKDRQGSAGFLIEHASEFSFETRWAEEVSIGDQKISSTQIREAILEGDLDRAASMLGRPFSIYGTVVKGDGRGRSIGFPTANLDLHHELRPPRGVYGCRAVVDGREWFALVNIGVRPTFEAKLDSWESRDRYETVEVHLLGCDADLYGEDMEVFFLTRLRGERRFDGAEALARQIEADKQAFLAHVEDEDGGPRR